MKNFRFIISIAVLICVAVGVYLTVSSLNATLTLGEKDNVFLLPKYSYQISKNKNVNECNKDCYHKLIDSNWEEIERDKIPSDEQAIYRIEIDILPEIHLLEGPLALLLSYFDIESISLWTKDGGMRNYKGGASVKEFIKLPINLHKDTKSISLILVTKKTNGNLLFFNSLIFLGETTSLTNIYFHNEREKVTTPLLYIMLSITFIVIFILFQFLSKKEDLYWKKGMLALASSFSIFLTSYLPLNILDQTYLLYFFLILRLTWSLLFIYIFIDIAKIYSNKLNRTVLTLHTLLFVIITAIQLLPTPETESIKFTLPTLLLTPIILSFTIVLRKLVGFIKSNSKGIYLSYICVTLGLLLVGAITIVASNNLTFIYYYDFFVLLFLALNSILEFRLNEKTIDNQREKLISAAQDSAISFTAKSMAHDLRKPLAQISSILENLSTYKNDEDLLKTITKQMNKNIAHSELLLSSLLDFSKEGEIEKDSNCPKSLIKESLSLLDEEIKSKSIEVSLNFNHNTNIICNKPRITRVITNIIQNAIEIEETTRIVISTINKDNKVIFAVQNNGSYIESDKIEKIFDNFYSSGKPNGTGLGLASCKKTLALHGNKIWAASNKRLLETTFSFELDSEVNKDIKNEKEEIKSKPNTTPTLLRVISCNDDPLSNLNIETTFKATIKESYENLEIEYYSFTTGEELLDSIDTLPKGAILLCDYNLSNLGGKLDGLDVLKQIEEARTDIDIYLMTSWDFDQAPDVRVLSSKFLKEDCEKLIESHLFFLDQRTH